MPYKRSFFSGFKTLFKKCFRENELNKDKKKGYTLAEILIALGIIGIISVLVLPVITTRAQNRSFALSYETEVKQMLNSLEGLPVNEGKNNITDTMMSVTKAPEDYSSSSGAYINKYMKVAKYCGNTPDDCFASEYFEYKDNDRKAFDMKDVKGACALLKNGMSICLKPQVVADNGKKSEEDKTDADVDEISGWIDLNGQKGPNVYGRDLRTFSINLKDRVITNNEDPGKIIIVKDPADVNPPCEGADCDPCKVNTSSPECCQKRFDEGLVKYGSDCCKYFSSTTECKKPSNNDKVTSEECEKHEITGLSDPCCEFKKDPKCCSATDTSDYCCSLNRTEACCEKQFKSGGNSKISAISHCCKDFPNFSKNHPNECGTQCIYTDKKNTQECCNTEARRKLIADPSDDCCKFSDVYRLGSAYENRCCRTYRQDSDACCKYKFNNPNWYTNHDINAVLTDTNHDKCCSSALYGIGSNNENVLSKCCSVPDAQASNANEAKCCHYFIDKKNLGSKLANGGDLSRCCDNVATYEKDLVWKECCLNPTVLSMSQNPHALSPASGFKVGKIQNYRDVEVTGVTDMRTSQSIILSAGGISLPGGSITPGGTTNPGGVINPGDARSLQKGVLSGKWQSLCCKQSEVKSSDNETARMTYYDNCCPSEGTWLNTGCCKNRNSSLNDKDTNGIDYGGLQNEKCCNYSRPASEACCKFAKDKSWDDGHGGASFRQKCCDLNDDYCSCDQLYNKHKDKKDKDLNVVVDGKNCCIDLKGFKDTEYWQNKCCFKENRLKSGSNGSSLDEETFKGACCLKNAGGDVEGFGRMINNLGQNAYCCDGSSKPTEAEAKDTSNYKNFCCNQAKNCGDKLFAQCDCDQQIKKKSDWGGTCELAVDCGPKECDATFEASQSGDVMTAEWQEDCCSFDKYKNNEVKDNISTGCCTWKWKKAQSDSSSWGRPTNGNVSNTSNEPCCSDNTFINNLSDNGGTGINSNAYISGCCSINNPHLADVTPPKECCKKVYSALKENGTDPASYKINGASVFAAGGVGCCSVIGDDDPNYPECYNPCKESNLKKISPKLEGYYNKDVTTCCQRALADPSDRNNYLNDPGSNGKIALDYCCNLTNESKDAYWLLSDSTTNNKDYVNRFGGTCCNKWQSNTKDNEQWCYGPSRTNCKDTSDSNIWYMTCAKEKDDCVTLECRIKHGAKNGGDGLECNLYLSGTGIYAKDLEYTFEGKYSFTGSYGGNILTEYTGNQNYNFKCDYKNGGGCLIYSLNPNVSMYLTKLSGQLKHNGKVVGSIDYSYNGDIDCYDRTNEECTEIYSKIADAYDYAVSKEQLDIVKVGDNCSGGNDDEENDCPDEPSEKSINSECCWKWETEGKLSSSNLGNKCCQKTGDSRYCDRRHVVDENTECSISWHIYKKFDYAGDHAQTCSYSAGGVYADVVYKNIPSGVGISIKANSKIGGNGYTYTCEANTDSGIGSSGAGYGVKIPDSEKEYPIVGYCCNSNSSATTSNSGNLIVPSPGSGSLNCQIFVDGVIYGNDNNAKPLLSESCKADSMKFTKGPCTPKYHDVYYYKQK